MSNFIPLLLALVVLPAADSVEWSRFRGPNGSGSETTGLPTEFGPDRNVIWKAELPQGFSSPVIHGNRIFLTGIREDTLITFAVDRGTEKVPWEREARVTGRFTSPARRGKSPC